MVHKKKKSVGLFQAGFIDADLHRISRLLSLGRHWFSFEVATSLNLGDPDIQGYGYSDAAFARILKPHLTNYDLVVVLTSVPIEENFFTRDIHRRVVLCTTYQAEQFIEITGRTTEEYFALSVCPELISTEFQEHTGRPWSDLFHQDLRGCLFDFQGIKSQISAYLTKVSMCDQCRALLSKANVDRRVISFAETLLAKIRRPTIRKALRFSVMSPFIGFFYGGVIIGFLVNVLSSLAFTSKPLSGPQQVILAILLFGIVAVPASVYGYLWVQYLTKTRRFAA